jgi:hypothetical protein
LERWRGICLILRVTSRATETAILKFAALLFRTKSRLFCRTVSCHSFSYTSGNVFVGKFPKLRSSGRSKVLVCRVGRGADRACWDRSRARSAVGGGLPLLLFRLQGGFTIPPWRRFPKPPYNAGRPNFSGPV